MVFHDVQDIRVADLLHYTRACVTVGENRTPSSGKEALPLSYDSSCSYRVVGPGDRYCWRKTRLDYDEEEAAVSSFTGVSTNVGIH